MGAVLGAVAVAVVASVQGASLGATLDAVLGVLQWWFSRVVSSDDRYDSCHVCGQVLLDDSDCRDGAQNKTYFLEKKYVSSRIYVSSNLKNKASTFCFLTPVVLAVL